MEFCKDCDSTGLIDLDLKCGLGNNDWVWACQKTSKEGFDKLARKYGPGRTYQYQADKCGFRKEQRLAQDVVSQRRKMILRTRIN